MYDLVISQTQKISNLTIEVWHFKFKKLLLSTIGNCHITCNANICKFIEHVQKDQHDNMILITKLLAEACGSLLPFLQKTYTIDLQHTERMADRYDIYKTNGEVDAYSKGISYGLKLYDEDIKRDTEDI